MDNERLLKAFGAWLTAERAMTPNTRDAYTSDARKLIDYFAAMGVSPVEIDIDRLHNFLAEVHELGISPRSQARVISAIRSFFAFLKIEGRIANNPALLLDMPRIGLHLPEVLTVDEIDRMLACCNKDDILERRNATMIELLYSSGLRVSELVGLTFANLYLDKRLLLVRGKGRKERLVPLSSMAIESLQQWIEEDRPQLPEQPEARDVLFLNRRGRALTRNMVFIIIKNLAAKAGITKTVSPHTLRHSFATHLLDGGAPLHAIRLMLGHASIATTELYLHIDRSQLREQILTYHPRNKASQKPKS